MNWWVLDDSKGNLKCSILNKMNKYWFFHSFTINLWIPFYARKKEKPREKRTVLPKPIDLVNNESQVCCVMYLKESKTESAKTQTWSNPACKRLLEKWMFDLSCPPLMEVMIKRVTDRERQTHRTDITKQPSRYLLLGLCVSSFLAFADRGIDWERRRMQPCRNSRCAVSLTASLCWCSNRLHACISMSVCVRLCVCVC